MKILREGLMPGPHTPRIGHCSRCHTIFTDSLPASVSFVDCPLCSRSTMMWGWNSPCGLVERLNAWLFR